jgi:hypothetical protein
MIAFASFQRVIWVMSVEICALIVLIVCVINSSGNTMALSLGRPLPTNVQSFAYRCMLYPS